MSKNFIAVSRRYVFTVNLTDFGDELVALSRNGGDKAVFTAFFAENFS